MASYNSAGSRLTLRLRVGTKPSGLPDLRSVSFRGIDALSAAADVLDTSNALSALLAHPVVETRKTDDDLVVA